MEALLTAIVTWLSVNLGMPAIYDHPRIALVPPETMHAVRYGKGDSRRAGSALESRSTVHPDQLPDVDALYDDASRTIYLDEKWTGRTPAELSVLVHEMVHHLQHVAGLKYPCAAAREKPAYAAQKQWLALFGRKLTEEFELDPMTLLVRTNCMH